MPRSHPSNSSLLIGATRASTGCKPFPHREAALRPPGESAHPTPWERPSHPVKRPVYLVGASLPPGGKARRTRWTGTFHPVKAPVPLGEKAVSPRGNVARTRWGNLSHRSGAVPAPSAPQGGGTSRSPYLDSPSGREMCDKRAANVVRDFSRSTREKERQGTLRRETLSVNSRTDSAGNVAPTKVVDYVCAPTPSAGSHCRMRQSTYPVPPNRRFLTAIGAPSARRGNGTFPLLGRDAPHGGGTPPLRRASASIHFAEP